jgi:nucleoside 2-deoxyribosyltransferase
MKINMHTSHPSAFISSTFIDLYEDRNEVANALRERGLNVNALDIRPASTQSSRNEILNGIRESDFVILLIGDRFGSILKSMTASDSQSITWWEYVNAKKMGKPVIAYFKNFDSSDPNSHDDRSDVLYKKKRVLFERFKKIITQRHNPAFYSDPYELAEKLDASLISIYRAGVKTLSSSNSELSSKISQLESELTQQKSTYTTPSNQTASTTDDLKTGLSNFLGGTPKPQSQISFADLSKNKK